MFGPLPCSNSLQIVALSGSGLPLGLRAIQTGEPELPRSIRLDDSALLEVYPTLLADLAEVAAKIALERP